jgi:hypothetical protein
VSSILVRRYSAEDESFLRRVTFPEEDRHRFIRKRMTAVTGGSAAPTSSRSTIGAAEIRRRAITSHSRLKEESVSHPLETIRALADLWPKWLAVTHSRRLPLKIGIGKDLAAMGFDGNDIDVALSYYTSASAYLEKLQPGVPRVGP